MDVIHFIHIPKNAGHSVIKYTTLYNRINMRSIRKHFDDCGSLMVYAHIT